MRYESAKGFIQANAMGESNPKMPLRMHGVSNGLWNEDLAAVPKDERRWGASKFAVQWASTAVCIPAYLLASGLIAVGMTWKQALGTILLGSAIAMILIVLSGHAGATYGISFPVLLRASFGVLGAKVPAVLRALVACGWFGIQCWIGGEALFAMVRLVVPSVEGNGVWWCFAGFWILNMVPIWRGAKRTSLLYEVSAALLLIMGLALVCWIVGRPGQFGMPLTKAGTFPILDGGREFWHVFMPSLTGVVGFWSVVALNVFDFTRYARSQKAPTVGLAIGLPVTITIYSSIAIVVTAATVSVTLNHVPIWNPIELLASFQTPGIASIGVAVVLLSLLNTQAVASAAYTFSDLRTNLISRRMGGLIAGVLGIVFMPWRLVADPGRYIHGWLIGCAGVLGPIAGILIADYFIIRKRSLDVDALYVRGGPYEYAAGFNPRAFIALIAGVAFAFVGLFVPRLQWLYECSGFAGFGVAAIIYLILMSGPDVRAMIPPNPLLIPVDGFEAEPTA